MRPAAALLTIGLAWSAGVAFGQSAGQTDRRQAGNPLDHLPSNIEALTHFGERADISPDNQHVAFMAGIIAYVWAAWGIPRASTANGTRAIPDT